jgi:autotransporter-associated beta strand protein
MNKTIGGVIRFIAALCASVAASGALARTAYVWNPLGSGGWRSSGQYFSADGETPAASAPVEGDIVQIPAGTTVAVSTDDAAAFVNTLAGIELADATSKFIFGQPSDIRWRCAVFGRGAMVKSTQATVELLPNTQTDLNEKFKEGYSSYCTWGGLVVENGTLKLPQENSGGIYSFGPVTVAENATLVLIPDNMTQLAALDGYGVVTNTFPSGTGQNLQIGYTNFADQKISHFHGQIAGRINWYSTGSVYLHGTNNTFNGWTFMHWGRYSELNDRFGHLYLQKFGKNYGASSIGGNGDCTIQSKIGGAFHYMGTGEETNKKFVWTPDKNAAIPIMDAGANGGVSFSGNWSHASISPELLMGCLTLTGSNTAACVVSGKITTPADVATYFTKSGSGTWCFANDENSYDGALAVTDGTFRFTSIAEAGEPCALGLSTILHEPYINTRNDTRKVDYAFLLGGSGKMPTFEYMGGKLSVCSSRPLALTGDGGRLISSGEGSELRFAGISSFDPGEKTLVLGGDSDGNNMVSNIVSGGGSVAVAKEGAGRWIISGENSIFGKLEVREGTLELWDRYAGEKYPYYRLVIKKISNSYQALLFSEFALYDADGVNRAASLKFREPSDVHGSNSGTPEYQPVDITELEPGEAFFHSASGNKVFHYPVSYGQGLDQLFDGTVRKDFCMSVTPFGKMQPNGTPERYVYVVMRLPDDTPPILSYDIYNSHAEKYITVIGVEASKDGKVWVDLTGDVQLASAAAWASGDEFAEGHPARPGRGLVFGKVFAAPDADGAAMLDGVTSVQVAAGATLAAKGVGKTLGNLTVDCTGGAGSLEGFDFSADGTINLVNIPEKAVDFTVPVKFGKVSAASLANINTWSVSVNGKPSSHWDVKVTAGIVSGTKRGMCIIVR